jgi:ATP-dependent exoDNAse (exonuclease V) alpha subunit
MIEEEKRVHLKCAPTGIAATNIKGATLHSTFQININTYKVGKRWPEVEVLYIDEISMVSSKLFQAALEGVPNAEEVIVFGDLAQLPPINGEYFFHGIEDQISVVRLTTQYRQAGDSEFTTVLNKIRAGDMRMADIHYLNKHATNECVDDCVTLAFRNVVVDSINSVELNKLPNPVKLLATYGGSFKPQDCIADQELELAVGAKVIMLNNDAEGRWANGTSATIHSIAPNIRVRVADNVCTIERHIWDKQVPFELTDQRREEIDQELTADVHTPRRVSELTHALETGIEYRVVGLCKQFPIKLAYAMTVHKAQGMTLDRVTIVPDLFNRAHGIGYVALSRARTIDTVSFSRRLTLNDFKFDPTVENWV